MKALVLSMLCVCVVIGGCEVFSAPFKLFQELLPLAIKYAPYALMFLELPQDGDNSLPPDIQAQLDLAVQSPEQMRFLSDVLAAKLYEKSSALVAIHAVELDSWDKVAKLQQWLEQNNGQYKINCLITAYNCEDNFANAKIAETIFSHGVQFLADGSLQGQLAQIK